ncbi:Uncharacterised protein [uncultured archaeon]|nr:Uncharacterised protein [uncultured archaeon]
MDAFPIESSINNSSIRFEDQRNITNAPFTLSVGSGYYSSHPISYSSGIGSSTQMADKNSATYLGHEVDTAHGISGATEFMASSSSYSQYGPDYSVSGSQSTAHMKIDENVTEGKVHIGVLQGSSPPGQEVGGARTDPLIDAWKSPSVEVDEDYIGTYHIYKNVSLSSDQAQRNGSESWPDCCKSSYFDIDRRSLPAINADRIFSYKSLQ